MSEVIVNDPAEPECEIRDQMNRMDSGKPYKITILRAGQVLELTGKVP